MNSSKILWPGGCRAAISLTYDDGAACHPDLVAPQLEANGFRGTFYAPMKSDLMQHPLAWRAMAQKGHELGNHTVFHPCRSVNGKYDSWLAEEFNLVNYDEERWQDEISTGNQALWLVDGEKERTFGNTCFDNYIGPTDAPVCLEPLIARHFAAARGENTGKPVNLQDLNLYNLGTIWADRRTFSDFTGELEALVQNGGWIIYTFHGVGQGSHNHFIDTREHLRLLAFLKDNSNVIWTAPVLQAVKQLLKHQ